MRCQSLSPTHIRTALSVALPRRRGGIRLSRFTVTETSLRGILPAQGHLGGAQPQASNQSSRIQRIPAIKRVCALLANGYRKTTTMPRPAEDGMAGIGPGSRA